MTRPKGAPRLKKGGQPGNVNALTHGYYDDRFTLEELTLFAAVVGEPSLTDEIWLQRVVNRRLAKLIGNTKTTQARLLAVAAALAVGTGRVARLLRDQKILDDDTADSLTLAIQAALEDFRAKGLDV